MKLEYLQNLLEVERECSGVTKKLLKEKESSEYNVSAEINKVKNKEIEKRRKVQKTYNLLLKSYRKEKTERIKLNKKIKKIEKNMNRLQSVLKKNEENFIILYQYVDKLEENGNMDFEEILDKRLRKKEIQLFDKAHRILAPYEKKLPKKKKKTEKFAFEEYSFDFEKKINEKLNF